MRNTTLPAALAACLASVVLVSPVFAQDPPGAADTTLDTRDDDDDDGFDDWGLLGLIGLLGLLGRKRRDDVHVVTRTDTNPNTPHR